MDGIARLGGPPPSGIGRASIVPRLGGSPPISGSGTGYPWVDGDILYAADLNAAIASSAASVLLYGAKGDGLTDDTAAIQAALNANAGKAPVFIPATSSFYNTAMLQIPSNTDLIIDGTLKLRSSPPPGGHLVYVLNASNVTIRGNGTLDGNNTANSYTTVTVGTLFIMLSSNVKVSGLTIQNAPLWNLVAQQSSNILFTGVTLIGGRNASGFSVNCNDCWLMNSVINGPDDDIGFSFYGGITNSGAIGNTVTASGMVNNVAAVGLNVLGDAGQKAPCKNIVIANNIITNCGGSGLQVFTDQPGLHDGVVIIGNRCDSNGQAGIGNRGDIDISHCVNVLVEGNQSSNFGNGGAQPWWGLYAGVQCGGCSFIGNQVYSTGTGGTGIGLNVAGAGTLLASGNSFYDNRSTPTMTASIAGTAGAQNVFIGNYCERPVTITTTTDTVMHNAVGNAMQLHVNSNGIAPLWIDGPAGVGRLPVFTTSGSARWYFGLDSSAESGSDAGSNFVIARCHDSGANIDVPFSINRQTGSVTYTKSPFIYPLPPNAINDAAAASAGVGVGQYYRNGSQLMIRAA